MDTRNDFYIVLPSNTSMSYFPDNTTSCFTTHLSREIKLHGEWHVGLMEIHVPCSIVHFQDNDAFHTFSSYGLNTEETTKCHFLFGIYKTLYQLADAINRSNETYNHHMLEPVKERDGYYALRRKCDCTQPHASHFNEKIGCFFGFDDDELDEEKFKKYEGFRREIVAARPASLSRAIPDQLYVYTDIYETYSLGDTHAALLRIVSLSKTKFGCNAVQRFDPAHYIPLLYHNFNNIIIDIRDQHCRHIPFEYGTSTVMLHFRRSH